MSDCFYFEKAQNLQLQFEPDTVVVDFQGAIKQVIQLNFQVSSQVYAFLPNKSRATYVRLFLF